MQTQITFRHTKSNPTLTDAANEMVSKLEKYNDNITSADVVFTQDVNCIVEVFLQINGSTLIAKEESEDFIKSLNSANDKLMKQLRKLKTRDEKNKTEVDKY